MTDKAQPASIASNASVPAAYSPERREDALRRINRRAFTWRWLRDWAESVIIAVAVWLVVRAFFVETYRIPTGSMERTLLVGDRLLVNKLAFGPDLPFTARRLPGLEHPHRGDIVVFRWPVDKRINFIKRIVGVPGDTLSMVAGLLSVNGVQQSEPYAVHQTAIADLVEDEAHFGWQRQYAVHGAAVAAVTHVSRNNWGPLVVPKQSYFVLGDNRDNSDDSRYWGFVPAMLIEGRPILVAYSFAPDSAGSGLLTRVRWNRIGERVE